MYESVERQTHILNDFLFRLSVGADSTGISFESHLSGTTPWMSEPNDDWSAELTKSPSDLSNVCGPRLRMGGCMGMGSMQQLDNLDQVLPPKSGGQHRGLNRL